MKVLTREDVIAEVIVEGVIEDDIIISLNQREAAMLITLLIHFYPDGLEPALAHDWEMGFNGVIDFPEKGDFPPIDFQQAQDGWNDLALSFIREFSLRFPGKPNIHINEEEDDT